MTDKDRYFKLDDIGRIGSQRKRSPIAIQKDKEKLAKAIKRIKLKYSRDL